jgi:mono/diheme cytochrome c family protein
MKLISVVFTVIIFAVLLSAFKIEKPVKVIRVQNAQTPMNRGKVVYTQYCMPCHQVDGSGVPNMNPPLIKTSYVLGDKTTLVSIIVKGLNKGVVIDGEEYTNPMPAQSFLTDQQVADVTTYVRNSFGNKAAGLTLAEVKAIKAKLK